MFQKGVVALALLVAGAWAVEAQTLVSAPTSNPVDAPTFTLDLGNNDAETQQVLHRYRRSYYRSYSYYRPYRSYYRSYSYYRPYYRSYSYYRPYYRSYSYYRPYYRSYSYYPSYSYGYSSYYYPSYSYYGGYGYCSLEGDDVVVTANLGDWLCVPVPPCYGESTILPPSQSDKTPLMPKVPEGEGGKQPNYKYDGGPKTPVPIPGNGSGRKVAPEPVRPAVLPKGHLVRLPGGAGNSGHVFLAYGEQAQPAVTPRAAKATPTARPQTSGFGYAAYGERQGATKFATQR